MPRRRLPDRRERGLAELARWMTRLAAVLLLCGAVLTTTWLLAGG